MTKLILAIFAVFVVVSTACADDFALIVNQANPESSLSQAEAKSIFLGKKTSWPSGVAVLPVLQEGSPVHQGFTKAIVGKSPRQFSNYWKKALFTGTGITPRSLNGDSEVMAFVAANEGAIGYVSAAAVDDSVKRLEIR